MENWNIQSIILVGNKMVLELEIVKKVAHIEVSSWLHSVGSWVGLGFLFILHSFFFFIVVDFVIH